MDDPEVVTAHLQVAYDEKIKPQLHVLTRDLRLAFSASVPAFHDVNSNAVLTPLNVRVNGQFILRSTPGVANSAADVVSCSYIDPAGLFVEITGVLSGR